MEGLPSKEEIQEMWEEISVATERLHIAESAWQSCKDSRDQAWESYHSKLKEKGEKDQEELQHLKELCGDSANKLNWAKLKVTTAALQLKVADDKLRRANEIANVIHKKKKPYRFVLHSHTFTPLTLQVCSAFSHFHTTNCDIITYSFPPLNSHTFTCMTYTIFVI